MADQTSAVIYGPHHFYKRSNTLLQEQY